MKECSNCHRTLSLVKFRNYINNTTGEKKDSICFSCRAHRGPKPTLLEVEAGERQLQSLIKRAAQKFDPVKERIMFEEFLYKIMITDGYLKEWKRPVWLNDNLFKDEEVR